MLSVGGQQRSKAIIDSIGYECLPGSHRCQSAFMQRLRQGRGGKLLRQFEADAGAGDADARPAPAVEAVPLQQDGEQHREHLAGGPWQRPIDNCIDIGRLSMKKGGVHCGPHFQR